MYKYGWKVWSQIDEACLACSQKYIRKKKELIFLSFKCVLLLARTSFNYKFTKISTVLIRFKATLQICDTLDLFQFSYL